MVVVALAVTVSIHGCDMVMVVTTWPVAVEKVHKVNSLVQVAPGANDGITQEDG